MSAWQVKVVEHGTGKLVAVPKHGAVRWSRRLDEMTEASTSWWPEESPKIERWRHELEIWGWNRLVWAGPIVRPQRRTDQAVTVSARDLWMRIERLFVARDRTYEQEDLGMIFGQLLRDALEQAPTLDISVVTNECGTTGDRVYEALLGDRVADKLRELARTAVDWTIVGRQLVIGGATIPGRRTWKLHDGMCASAVADDDGLGQVNDAIVRGSKPVVTTTDDDGDEVREEGELPVGRWIDNSSVHRIGPLQVGYSEPTILDETSAGVAARNRVGVFGNSLPDLTVLLKEGEYDPDDLVPGSLVDVALSPALVAWGQEGAYTLTQVDGTIGEDGEAAVTVSFTQQDTTA